MDEQVLKLFAEVGPNAEKALNSWVTLQWVEFLVPSSIGIIILITVIIAGFKIYNKEL